VATLINAGGFAVNQQDRVGGTPLTCATMGTHEGVLKLLLEQEDIDPNCPGLMDITPLGWAALTGNEGVVKLLLE